MTIPIIISSLALLISILSLILNRLIPFKPKIINTTPTFSLYEIPPSISGNDQDKTWYIPSFDVGLSMFNIGKRSGEIVDIRIVATIIKNEKMKKHEFYPKWIIDYSKFQQDKTNRMKWIKEAVISNWSPILLFGNNETKVHLILEEYRWDEIFNGKMNFDIEYVSSKKEKWIKLNSYDMPITIDMFTEKSSYSPYDRKLSKHRHK